MEELKIKKVCLLEDRAEVIRSGKLKLEAGQHRIEIENVSPILQDLSLRAEVKKNAKVFDVRVKRKMNIRATERPEEIAKLEAKIEELTTQFVEMGEDRKRAEQRYEYLMRMLALSIKDISFDAAWGYVNADTWHETIDALSKKAENELSTNLDTYFSQIDLSKELETLIKSRTLKSRPDINFSAKLEVDIEVKKAHEIELEVSYIVPNALWRPIHSAQLIDDKELLFSSRAAIWQNTGEDWNDVELIFSTARTTSGTEPPLLEDDELSVQKRAESFIVETRQVSLQNTGMGREPGTAPPPKSAVELPGVDDGGDIQHLSAKEHVRIASDGRLNIVPIFSFKSKCEKKLVCYSELAQMVFIRTELENKSKHPILAGPVELIRQGGVAGWTQVLFIAPGEDFYLSFGHDDNLRIYRTQKQESETDSIDHWKHNDAWVTLYLSNLSDEKKEIEVIERIPISEVEYVKVTLDEDECAPSRPAVDENGFCSWELSLDSYERKRVSYAFRISSAPEVEGI